jgi:SAM-dependent methyltransferase
VRAAFRLPRRAIAEAPEYGDAFYQEIREGSCRSAKIVLPLVFALLRPQSVLDLGCGDGTWLAVAQELGVEDVLGVDGEYARPELQIPESSFVAADLRRPLRLDRKFDLALSLEVAEHLPADSADDYVGSLTSLAPAVLFSAAIPLQSGVNHVNEQWPEYWADLFERRGFTAIDCVRRQVWRDADVEWWYAQNTILYLSTERLAGAPELAAVHERHGGRPLSVVHPRKYDTLVHWSGGEHQDRAHVRR